MDRSDNLLLTATKMQHRKLHTTNGGDSIHYQRKRVILQKSKPNRNRANTTSAWQPDAEAFTARQNGQMSI